MHHSNVVQLFPKTHVEVINGVRVTFTKNDDGTVSWEFVKPVTALRLTGSGESLEIAKSRAMATIHLLPGSRDARSPTK